ncbi:ferrous iron transport protein A [Phototrophicus methaneseepsis]|uniref:Ferrous iron transport protein A n=1 Tax=Phototrophicus methaneseepsis TaxID=2710758 RepID=A0A7S8E535_9CHLR|nr:FeoA family protein [Phototrophicus methaneseepsis]QPC80510.1 ferrous iron transport protein A [Phototrophicus methaneseepsis]
MSEVEVTDSFPLMFAEKGEVVWLTEIRSGDKLRRRLNELGLYVGMEVRVVQGSNSGPMILAVKNDTRLAVGRGMAQKIMVKRSKGAE